MTRRVSPQREYAELYAYISAIATYVFGIDPASRAHPANIAKEALAEQGEAKALSALRQAANDTVEALRYYKVEQLRRVDEVLAKHGSITFSEVCRRYGSSYRRILRRGRIKNDAEYYLLAGALADAAWPADAGERQQLQGMLVEYEEGAKTR